ncbi:unnamed protein product [Schistocephalus solidus]|uniref:Reverse transcriptase domain-containing protein n=1 Tax=Schistocephalus solidus TaxID=70667 RepID=A0A183TLD9_SCHSO|nr:unnamed protein product [Schistocephalus solidus]
MCKDLNLNGKKMLSLDVSSLFTNVPVTETVDYLCEFLLTSEQETGIPTNALKELLLICTLNVQFLFDNELYRQIDGVAMCSPLGHLLADVFMGKLEKFQLSGQINNLRHYGRYVDDIFAIVTRLRQCLARANQNLLRENGYPDRFIAKHLVTRPVKPANVTVEKKTLFLKVPFQGDVASELLKRRLNQAVSQTFPAAKLQIVFSNNPLLRGEGKDRLPDQTTSMCSYSFTCSCGVGYIGRTSRRLSKRIKEHIPAWLSKGEVKSIKSAILAHLVDTGHSVDPIEPFRVIYKVPPNYRKPLGQRLLAAAEPTAIRLKKLVLCAQ